MALTRNDKVLILAAITLAAAVVGGLALWRKTMRPAEEATPAPISASAPGAQAQLAPGVGPAPPVQPGASAASSGGAFQGTDMPATAGQAGVSARMQAPAAPGAPATGTVTQPIAPDTGSLPDPSLGTIFSEKPAPDPEPVVAPPALEEEPAAPPAPPVVKKPETKAERKARIAAERKVEQEERLAKAESLRRAKEELKRAEAELKRVEAEAKKHGVTSAAPTVTEAPAATPAAKAAPAGDKGKAVPAPAPTLAPVEPTAPAVLPVQAAPAAPEASPSSDASPAKGKAGAKKQDKTAAPVDASAAVAALKSASQERRTIDKVQVTETSGELSILLKGASTNEAPHSLLLSSPPRLVVDLPGTWAFKGQAGAGPGGSVQRVRIGKYNDKMRVVFDLTALPGKSKDKPPVEKTPEGLLIRLAK